VAGFLILPGTLVAAILLPAAGRLSDEVAPQIMICIGIALFAASNILMAAADANTMFVAITLFIFIGRIGQAFVTPTISATALKVLPGHKLQQGAGILNFCMLFGGACGINSYVVVLERRTQIHGEALTTTQTAANPATRELLEGIYRLLGEEGFPVAQQSPVALKYLGEIVQAQANTFGFQDGFIAITIVSLVAIIPTSLLLLHRR